MMVPGESCRKRRRSSSGRPGREEGARRVAGGNDQRQTPSPTLRQFYSFLPVCFLRLKIQPPYFMRTLTVVVFIWNNIGCWDEKAVFTFPNMPPVPFVTTASSLNSADLQFRATTVMSITSSEKIKPSMPHFPRCQQAKLTCQGHLKPDGFLRGASDPHEDSI
ncbi:hypothetical protein Anapl_15531 [Anas platyrhynchos]|uniref:Uncharacterized protein n=1 Tax=Anas platyrhynchos TaxID=8839 RepID=R0JQR7_ANAPL|nr:hypothetical protein Anapl_15531 [Anas platyrhynchos]